MSLDGGFSVYFTQTLLKDYIEEEGGHHWRVVWDARGHLIEPFTRETVGLGGADVGSYVHGWNDGQFEEYQEIDIAERIETKGPVNRFASVLFIEKEGFTEILKDAGIQEKYDIALMSTKGLPVKAACDLAGELEINDVNIYVLHDFDLAGFKIMKTLLEGTRMAVGVAAIDLGLRLGDVAGLQSEPVEYHQRKDPREYLAECGATGAEQGFLVEGRRSGGGSWVGQRVELNAMTSVQLVEWIEKKLTEYRVSKVIPAEDVLASAYKRAKYLQDLEAKARQWKDQWQNTDVPSGLKPRVAKILNEQPRLSWDDAVWRFAEDDGAEAAK